MRIQNYLVRNLFILLLVSGGFVCAPGKADEQKTVEQVVRNFWSAKKKMDWKGMATRFEFPFAFIQVGPRYAGRLQIIRNRRQFENEFMDIKKDLRSRFYYEVDRSNEHIYALHTQLQNTLRVSNKLVLVPSAVVTYTYQPGGDKSPITLTTHLRNTEHGWKIVFSTIPWY